MFVTSAEQRGGLLAAVITGGRPRLKDRPTGKYLDKLAAAGVADIVWVVSDRDAPNYERDRHKLAVYPHDWAYEYAREHWLLPSPPEPGGFLGAFPGREWACREAERYGCWGVLQLDDNIARLFFIRDNGAGEKIPTSHGGLGLHADLLAAMALATNARSVGAQLAINTSRAEARQNIRPGFPYSLFIERVGPGREPWYGPFEDDITHSFQYGNRADGATAAVVPALHYGKEAKSKTGMRARYDQTRAVQLQRAFPQGARLSVHKAKSNGLGGPRVFHSMPRGAIRNPVTIADPALYQAAIDRLNELRREWFANELAANRAKVLKRAGRA